MGLKASISAGHGPETPGKRSPDGYREFQFNYPTAELVAKYLSEYEGVSTLKVYDPNRDVPLAERTAKAHSWDADIYISIHYNAAGSTWTDAAGIETLVYSSLSTNVGYKAAQKVHAALIAATGRKNRGIKDRPGLWEMRATTMPAFLCECGFMDNKEERTLMASPAYQQQCARAIVDGIADYYKLKKKTTFAPPAPKPDTLWRVQIGAFGSKSNADQFLLKVKKSGFSDAFIKTSGGLHRIQVGAYSIYKNAQTIVERLKAKGFKDAWITK